LRLVIRAQRNLRQAEARERRIRAAFGRDLGERRVALRRIGAGQRRLEVGRSLQSLMRAVFGPAPMGGDRQHEQQRRADHPVAIFLPERDRLVAPEILFDLVEKVRHASVTPSLLYLIPWSAGFPAVASARSGSLPY